jgi:hypothetical protein
MSFPVTDSKQLTVLQCYSVYLYNLVQLDCYGVLYPSTQSLAHITTATRVEHSITRLLYRERWYSSMLQLPRKEVSHVPLQGPVIVNHVWLSF